MATKLAKAAMAGAHTAGIYADMTVDGPEMGTLVVVVDRARHLPNRKTMGKQDPYCAVRLGKDAKKTETDRRGGQTPKWDQELRFTVYDSPDYRKLKVSLFNDDKRCDLIGETWITLDDILEPGGGQRDTWHPLHYKGRAAGEVQLELTFWDLRPKEEKPEAPAPRAASRERSSDALAGPRQPMGRRPLPVEPNAGGAATAAAAAPAAAQRGPRERPPVHAHSAPPAPQQQPRPPHRHEPSARQPSPLPDERWEHGYDEAFEPDYDAMAVQADRLPPGTIDLPELPPQMPRGQRRSAPYPAQHYSPRDPPPPEHQLPQYSVSDGAFHDMQHDHQDGPPPLPPAHGGHHGNAPHADARARSERYASEPPPRMTHQPSYSDFPDAHMNGYRGPSPAHAQPPAHAHTGMDDWGYAHGSEMLHPEEAYAHEQHPQHPQHPHNFDPSHARRAPAGMPSYATPPRRELPPSDQRRSPLPAYGGPEMPAVRSHRASMPVLPRDETPEDAIMHRSTVPLVRPQPRSPVPRKPVSPAVPEASSGLNGIAFSPDSFDVLNPNLHAAASINEPGPAYNSPAELREAARDRQRARALEQAGPIVDARGRVIDPIDHLPSDTWAPEPEKRTPARRAHEVRLRFRHHGSSGPPSSAAHSSPSGRPVSLPPTGPPSQGYPPSPDYEYGAAHQSSPSPGYAPPVAISADPSADASPTPSPTRHRLFKKAPRGAASGATPAAVHSSPPAPYPTPLREMPNYGYGSSPAAPRGGYRGGHGGHGSGGGYHGGYGGSASSPLAGAPPPPIPAKIPLARGQEEWRAAPGTGLEAEIRGIDIGSSGRRRPAWRDV